MYKISNNTTNQKSVKLQGCCDTNSVKKTKKKQDMVGIFMTPSTTYCFHSSREDYAAENATALMNTKFCSHRKCDSSKNKVNISVNTILKAQFFRFCIRWQYLRKQIFSFSPISLLTAFCVYLLFVLPAIISFEERRWKTKEDILFCDFHLLWPYYLDGYISLYTEHS